MHLIVFVILLSNYSTIYCNDAVKKENIKYDSKTNIVLEIEMLSKMKWGFFFSYLFTAEIIRSYI